LGTAKVDISPQQPVQLAGFASRSHVGFEGIDSAIYARFFYLSYGPRAENAEQTVIVSADLIFWENEFAAKLRERIGKRWDIPQNAVILHATHSHSGPAMGEFVDLGDHDPDYLADLQEQIIDGVGKAIANAEQVTVERGIGQSVIAVNRRSIVDGKFTIAPNREGPVDREMNVIRFARTGGNAKAVLIHYTCHPVISAANRLCYEYCGAAMEMVEQQIGGDVVVGFLQGCCGEINPYCESGMEGYEAIREIGRQLAEVAVITLKNDMTLVSNVNLRHVQHTVKLPYQRTPSLEELDVKQRSGTALEQQWAAYLMRHTEKLQPFGMLELTTIEIADRLILLFMSGEMGLSYGLFVKARSGGTTLPVAYTNGAIGYVMTAEQLEEGGYEPVDSVFYYGLPAPYASETESIIMQKLEETVRRH
jgi:hypothetical protein